MTNLDLMIVVPATPQAHALGCTCPDAAAHPATWPGAMLSCGGHLFSPDCPVHRQAVRAEVQRMFGRPQ